jgi:hypothetical protein
LIETDDEFRVRRLRNIGSIGAGTEESIRSAIINDLSGISGCSVVSNRSDVIDSDGRPPHSFEVVVSGGDENEIANKIWEKQPAGILSFGLINIIVQDSQGINQLIRFSRPVSKYIWVKIKRDLYAEEIYPVDGDAQIKQAIVDWSLNVNNIDVGVDVIRQRLSIPVYTIPGVGDIEIEIDATALPSDTPTYLQQNIDLAPILKIKSTIEAKLKLTMISLLYQT